MFIEVRDLLAKWPGRGHQERQNLKGLVAGMVFKHNFGEKKSAYSQLQGRDNTHQKN